MKGFDPDTGKPTNLYEFCDTRKQRKLQDAADALLYKAGFFPKDLGPSDDEYIPWDVDCISTHGLRPTWHGTV